MRYHHQAELRQQVTADLFDLDQLRLDRDWLNQAKLVYEYGCQLADARDLYERRKRKRDVLTAELDLAIRKNPAKYGLEKTTENSIASTILLDIGLQQAENRVLSAKHNMDLLQALMHALEDRKKALEHLVSLWTKSYFAEPQAPEGAKELIDKMEDKRLFGKKRAKQ